MFVLMHEKFLYKAFHSFATNKKVFTTSAITIKTNLIAIAIHFMAKNLAYSFHKNTNVQENMDPFTLQMRGVFRMNVDTII